MPDVEPHQPDDPTRIESVEDVRPRDDRRLTQAAKIATVVLGVVAAAAALNVAAVAVLPVAAALLLTLMLWPLQSRMSRYVPRWISAAGITSLAMGVLLMAMLWGWYSVDAAISQFQDSRQKYVDTYQAAQDWLIGIGVPDQAMPDVPNGVESPSRDDGDGGHAADASAGNDGPPPGSDGASSADSPAPIGADRPNRERDGDWRWATGDAAAARDERDRVMAMRHWEQVASFVVGGLRSIVGVVAAILLTMFLLYLALWEGKSWDEWARRQLSSERYAEVRALVHLWSRQTRRHFLAKTISGFISGGATALWLWIMGVPLPIVWGVLTLLLNFVPNIGAVISGLPPTILAVVELGWWQGLLVAGGLAAIEALVGNLLDPMLEGGMLGLSTFGVLASLIFWGWLWGIAGAVMAPVLTAGIVTALKQWPESRSVYGRAKSIGRRSTAGE